LFIFNSSNLLVNSFKVYLTFESISASHYQYKKPLMRCTRSKTRYEFTVRETSHSHSPRL